MTAPVCIYALFCPSARRIRYIGKSNQPVARIYHHIHAAVRRYNDHHTARWIRKLAADGLKPRLRILFWVPNGADWRKYERDIISRALAKGWRLTNLTKGREGIDLLSPEQEARRRQAIKDSMTPGSLARRSESARTKWADPEFRARIVAAQKAAAQQPVRRRQLAMAAKAKTADGKARQIAGVKAYFAAKRSVKP